MTQTDQNTSRVTMLGTGNAMCVNCYNTCFYLKSPRGGMLVDGGGGNGILQQLIKAKIPFENDPVGFYRWWRKGKHEEKVYLSLGYQVMLFQKVALMDPKVMLKKDLEMVR